nr:hypothetical protein [Lysobacter terrestris]
MTIAHDLPWTPEQHEWLLALGHDVLMPAAPQVGIAPEPLPVAVEAKAAPRSRDAAVPAPGSPALLRALARAAGRNEADAEFLQRLPDLATLRGNPAARRALWPSLRALRTRTSR